MGAEKVGSKSGGFFHLFDWNKKSRKKLFSNSPEGLKQGKRIGDNLPTTRLRLVDEDEVVGASSVKGSSDYSCASSVTDEEGNGIRAPGVVARLMGLDSMPTSGVSEPYSTPLLVPRSLPDNQSHKRSPEFYMNDQFDHVAHRTEGYFRKPIEFRSHKMPSSPIERFQMEALPPRSAKSLPITHHKLLSPIKNHGFTSAKNAAQVMEAAAKIIEPGLQASTKGKASSFGSSSIPLKIRDPKETISASHRTSRLLELSRMPVESTDGRFARGENANRSWSNSEDIVIFRPSPDPYENNAAVAKGKGKSISLAIQAKVNVQKREGLSTSNRNTSVNKEHDDYRLNQPFRSQPSNQKNKQLKKPSTNNASGVLRQNNQKQNCPSSKGKLASKQTVSGQQGRKVHSGDSSSGKQKTVSKVSGTSKGVYRKEVLVTADLDRREGLPTSNKDFPRKKRLIDGSFNLEKSGFGDNKFADRHDKRGHSYVVIDEHSRWNEDTRNATDVVSFTFTSPLIKPSSGSQSSTQVVEKWDKRKGCSLDSHGEKSTSESIGKRSSALGLSSISGDALSLLLEQKLRELTSGCESSCNFIKEGNFSVSASALKDLKSAHNTSGTSAAKNEKDFQLRHCKNKYNGGIFNSDVSSTNCQVFGMNHKLRIAEGPECSSSSDARKEPDNQNPSPLSILDASFSNQSCNSSESSSSTNGSKLSSSVQAQNIVGTNNANRSQQVEAEMELLDSASSAFSESLDLVEISRTSHLRSDEQDLEYVKEILRNSGLMSKDLKLYHFAHGGNSLGPVIFDKLENKRTEIEGEDKDGRLRRKVVFDCVSECLNMKCNHYFQAGCRAWAKGVAIFRRGLAEELYKEIKEWKSMGDWMVDELVDKDMSSHLGRWLDFEIEAFETGAEIEGEILNSLVDEVIADFCVKG